MNATRLSMALLVLRIGLGVFLLLWSIDKLVAPEGMVAIYQFFYDIGITIKTAYVAVVLGVCSGHCYRHHEQKQNTYVSNFHRPISLHSMKSDLIGIIYTFW